MEERLDHQVKSWQVQRFCGALIMLIIAFTTLGLFGSGVLSSQKQEKQGITVHYEKFLRYEKEMSVSWHVRNQRAVQVSVPQHYLASFKIEKIFPEAYETHIADGAIRYLFRLDGRGDLAIRFYFSPQKVGNITDTWQVNDADFRLAHFIYP
ncbi:hypothetical protein [Parapedobacter deserti]|uniref:hypothetical protein n=1 Tax=Parapedobacter deserti TaxID=1912957 RepID=UPI00366F8DE1